MAGNAEYDFIFNSRINIDWDEEKIDELGKKVTDLSGQVDLTKFDEKQQKELKEYGIESVKDLFEFQDGRYQFNDAIRQLGSSVMPAIIKEVQTFGRALTDISRAGKTYSTQLEADAKTATAYRTVVNSGSLLRDMSKMQFSASGTESLYGDVLQLVSRRFEQMARKEPQTYSREMWSDILSGDQRLRKQVSQVIKQRNMQVDDDAAITELIKNGVVGLGSKTQIDNRRALFAPLYEHTPQQNDPTDIFGHKSLKSLYERNGVAAGSPYTKPQNEKELAYSKGVYEQIRKLQKNGNRFAQDLAIETGLARFSEMTEEEVRNSRGGHDPGLVLRWNEAPEADRIRKFLGRAMQEGRKVRSGQDIYLRDPDSNKNINKQFQEILELTNAFSSRATGENGEAFLKKFIESAGADIDLSKLPAPVFGKIISKIQDTTGRIPTYGVPYTTLSKTDKGLVFEPRTQQDMQRVVMSTGSLKTKNTDKGILLEESQLTHLVGLHGSKNDPEHPVIVSMPVSDMWERDEEGFLKSGKDKRLTKSGELQVEAITNGATYNDNPYDFIYSNGESATFVRRDKRKEVDEGARKIGLSSPFYGYDPTIEGFVVHEKNEDTGEWETNTAKTNKMITSAKRSATQGRALRDIVDETKRNRVDNMKYGAVSLQAQREINEMLGADIGGMIVDGAGFIDPSLAPFSFQARGLGLGFKGVLGNYDWRDFLRKTVKPTQKTEKSPFIKFDENGQLSNLYMPSVSFQHLEEADRKAIISKLTSKNTKAQTKEDLLSKHFEDVMDSTLGALFFGDQLKTPSQMTVVRAEDYENLLTGERSGETDEEWAAKVKEAQNKLKEKRSHTKGSPSMSYIGADGKEYIRLNRKETSEHIAKAMKYGGGLFAVKSDEDFATGKHMIGQQVAEAMGFSPELRRKSAQLFAEKLDRMDTDDYWINEEQFSQRADIKNLFDQAEDKSEFIRNNNLAREYIQSQKDALRKQSMTHYMVENNTDTRLAFPFIGSFWEDVLSLTGADVDQTSELSWMYPSLLKNREYLKNNFKLTDRALDKVTTIKNRDALKGFGLGDEAISRIKTIDNLKTELHKSGRTISNEDLAKIRENENIDIENLMFSEESDRLWSIAGRTPAAINTFSRMLNLAAAPKNASQASVRGGGGLRLVTPEGIYRMNTGDFDGDTIFNYAYANEMMFRDLEQNNLTAAIDEETQKEIDALFEKQITELKKKKLEPTQGGRVAEQLYNFMSGQGEMGKASAIMRNALDLYPTNTAAGRRKFMQAYNLGSSAYDKATSEGQTMGWRGNYAHGFSNAAYLAGRQFTRFQKDVGDDWLRPYQDKEFESQPSIFKNRLLSLNNMMGISTALEAGKLRQGYGLDFGFGDMVDDWITNKYGASSKGYNKALYEVALGWGDILKGQYDLSHIVSNDDLSEFFRSSIDRLSAELNGSAKGSDEYTRLKDEIDVLKKARGKMTKGEGIKNSILTTDNLDLMIGQYDEGSAEREFYERIRRVHQLMPSVNKIIQDSEHQSMIDEELEKARQDRTDKTKRAKNTVGGLYDTYDEELGWKTPSVTAMEPYIKRPQELPVRRQRYDDKGNLVIDPSTLYTPDLWSKKYQESGIASDLARIAGKPRPSDLDTQFGTFVHDVYSSTALEETERGKYTEGDFLRKAKELWDTGGLDINGTYVSYKDYFTGKSKGEQLKDPLSDEDWEALSRYLGGEEVDLQQLKTLDGTVREKILNTFSRKGNNNEYFLRDLFRNGRLFEAENDYIDPNTGEKKKSPFKVRDPHDELGKATTSYRPDQIWEMNDGWLDMYDWKPNSEGAGKSIYQMIHYAETARLAAEAAKAKRDRGEALTSDDERWLEYFNNEGEFRIRNLTGKDYTGRGKDISFDYYSANKNNRALIDAVMGDYSTARELYFADRKDRSAGGLYKGFNLLVDAGIISKDEEIAPAFQKYFEHGTTYGQIEDAIAQFKSNPENIAKAKGADGEFSGQEYIKNHNDEWNYLVAKQAKNRESLDSVIENIRGVNSKYNRRATTEREYSQFDFLFQDLDKLNDPKLIAALSAVYSDVLPYAIEDIGKYEDDRNEQEKLLRSIVDVAAFEDPRRAEEAMRRQIYNSEGSNVFDRVQSIIANTNKAAGTRQSFKEQYRKQFFDKVGDREETDAIWATAGELQNRYDSFDEDFSTKEAKQARDEYDNFVRSLNERYGFEKNGLSAKNFMIDAGKYARAQEDVDRLRATERELISKIYEDDRAQTRHDVESLMGTKITPEMMAEKKIDKTRSDINNYIASSKMDILRVDKNTEDLIGALSRDFQDKESVKNIVSTGSIDKLDSLIENISNEDAGVLGQIKNLMLKRQTLQEAVTTLSDYMDNGFNEFASMTKEEAAQKTTTDRYNTINSARNILDSLSRTAGFAGATNAPITMPTANVRPSESIVSQAPPTQQPSQSRYNTEAYNQAYAEWQQKTNQDAQALAAWQAEHDAWQEQKNIDDANLQASQDNKRGYFAKRKEKKQREARVAEIGSTITSLDASIAQNNESISQNEDIIKRANQTEDLNNKLTNKQNERKSLESQLETLEQKRTNAIKQEADIEENKKAIEEKANKVRGLDHTIGLYSKQAEDKAKERIQLKQEYDKLIDDALPETFTDADAIINIERTRGEAHRQNRLTHDRVIRSANLGIDSARSRIEDSAKYIKDNDLKDPAFYDEEIKRIEKEQEELKPLTYKTPEFAPYQRERIETSQKILDEAEGKEDIIKESIREESGVKGLEAQKSGMISVMRSNIEKLQLGTNATKWAEELISAVERGEEIAPRLKNEEQKTLAQAIVHGKSYKDGVELEDSGYNKKFASKLSEAKEIADIKYKNFQYEQKEARHLLQSTADKLGLSSVDELKAVMDQDDEIPQAKEKFAENEKILHDLNRKKYESERYNKRIQDNEAKIADENKNIEQENERFQEREKTIDQEAERALSEAQGYRTREQVQDRLREEYDKKDKTLESEETKLRDEKKEAERLREQRIEEGKELAKTRKSLPVPKPGETSADLTAQIETIKGQIESASKEEENIEKELNKVGPVSKEEKEKAEKQIQALKSENDKKYDEEKRLEEERARLEETPREGERRERYRPIAGREPVRPTPTAGQAPRLENYKEEQPTVSQQPPVPVPPPIVPPVPPVIQPSTVDDQIKESLTPKDLTSRVMEQAEYKTAMERLALNKNITDFEALAKTNADGTVARDQNGKALFEDQQLQSLYDQMVYNRDKADWGQRTATNAQDILDGQNRLVDAQNLRSANAEFQKDMHQRELQHQFMNQQRSRLPSNSRFVNAYRRFDEIRYGLESKKEFLGNQITNKEAAIKDLTSKYEKLTPEQQKGEEGVKLAGSISQAQTELKDLNGQLALTENQMSSFNPAANAMAAGFNTISQSVNMLMKRFGRQMFMKAINEAKQFVKQYDKTMTEIQMITLKSDTEMQDVSSNIISKAKELKVSIGDVSQTAATLYRQGLSDEEVDDRLGVISKFSKVSGTKVADATKLITVAMNTGLVSNPEEAADIVTALGDNAATNAQQIEKGIEKAGAAAAADGTTFGELAAMLTAITSTTQIGGSVAGRTLNTIFGRMNKIGTNELIVDENGNKISGSAVAKLLKAQGIDMYDERGNKRSSFNTLYSLSKKWDSMSDAEQQQMATAIAGTRQYSNFSAIMQGMSEGKIDEYMELIGESSGITDKKYDVYTQSLEASLQSFKTTFDSIINDLADKGIIENIMSGLETIVTGIGEIISKAGGLKGLIPVLAPIALLMGGVTGGLPGIISMGAILAGVGIATAFGNAKQASIENSDENRYKKYMETQRANFDAYTSYASEKKTKAEDLVAAQNALYEQYKENDKLSPEQQSEYEKNLAALGRLFPDLSSTFEASGTEIGNWTTVLAASESAIENFSNTATEQAATLAKSIHRDINKQAREEIYDINKEYTGLDSRNRGDVESIKTVADIIDQDLSTGASLTDIREAIAVDDNASEKNRELYEIITSGDRNRKFNAFTKDGKIGNRAQELIDLGLIKDFDEFDKKYIQKNVWGETIGMNEGRLASDFYSLIEDGKLDGFSITRNIDYGRDNIGKINGKNLRKNPNILKNAQILKTMFAMDFEGTGLDDKTRGILLGSYSNEDEFYNDVLNGFETLYANNGESDYFLQRILSPLYHTLYNVLSDENNSFVNTATTERDAKIQSVIDEALFEHIKTSGVLKDITEEEAKHIKKNIIDKYGYDILDNSDYLTIIESEINKLANNRVDYMSDDENLPYEFEGKHYATEEQFREVAGKYYKEYKARGVIADKSEEDFINRILNKNTQKTLGELADTTLLSSKDLKYRDEYISLLNDAVASGDFETLKLLPGTKYQELISSKSDVKLQEIFNDLLDNNGNGKYTYSDLIKYLESAVYGSSNEEREKNLFNTSYKLSESKKWFDIMAASTTGDESMYKQISSVTEKPVDWIRKHWTEAQNEYKEKVEQNQTSFLSSARSQIWDQYKSTDENGKEYISQDQIENINNEYGKYGITASLTETGDFNLAYNPLDIEKYSALRTRDPVYTNANLAGIADELLFANENLDNFDWNKAVERIGSEQLINDRMIGWTEDDLNAAANYIPDLKKYLELDEIQRQSGYGQKLLENIQNQIVLDQIDTGTAEGALSYATTRYKQNNKLGLAADDIMTALGSVTPENAEQFSEIMKTAGVTGDTWKTMVESSDEFSKKFSDLGLKFDDAGNIDWSGIKEKNLSFEQVLSELIATVANASTQFNDLYKTNSELYDSAMLYTGAENQEDAKVAYSQIVGSGLASKIDTYGVEGLGKLDSLYQNAALSYYRNTGSIGISDEDKFAGIDMIMQHLQPGAVDQEWFNKQDTEVLSHYTQNYSDMINAIRDAKTPQEAAEAFEKLNEQVSNDKTAAMLKFKKGGDQTAKMLADLKRGGKEGAQAMATLRKQTAQLNDAALAIKKSRGKSGSELKGSIISDLTAITSDDPSLIKKMTKEELNDYLDDVQSSIDDEYVQSFVDPLQARLQELAEADPVKFMSYITPEMVVDGQLDTSEVEKIVAGLNDDVLNDLAAQAGLIGKYVVEIIQGNLSVEAISKFFSGNNSGSASGTGKKMGGGGGGGGGKSKVDKLLEDQKRKLAEIEHDNKMLQTQEKTFDYNNDYTGWENNINDQINGQYRMRDALTSNISEMENMLKTLKKGSDDWYKLRDAIFSAKEQLADITNTINELNGKHLDIELAKQEEADKPGTHRQNMLEKYAQRALNQDRFSDYERFTQEQIKEVQAQRTQNEAQIASLQSTLDRYEKGTDDWIETRDKIWALEEENADLDNQLVQAQLDLASQRLSQIAKVLEQNTQAANHNMSIAQNYGGAYESGGYRNQYEDMIREQQKANATLIAENKAAEASARAQMSTLEEGTTAWFEAQAAVYQYQEAVAEAEVSQLELNRALAESNLASVAEKYTDATRELSHVNELLQTQAQEYLDTNDYEAYFASMERYMDNLADIIPKEQVALAELRAQYDAGMAAGTLDPAMQRQYLDEINTREKELQDLILDQRQKEREINKNRLDKLFEDQDYAASEYDHNIKLVGYETSRYQNNGELTNVNTMIRAENKLREDRIETLKEEIKALEEEHDLFRDGSDDEKRIVEQIKKREEALSSENTQLEKNNKLLEENEKKIIQIRKALEDAVDKEIEAEKKRQREILAGNVSMQDTVLQVLRKSLQDQWNLKKKDIDKEKENLNEYKKLINERFNYRKKASQQADKDEELADYRRQLALIEADPSRTKDAKELRRKIEDLEKEQAWTIAEDEVNAEAQRIDDQMAGMDKFVQYNEELLNEILGDANNFSTEINEILSGSFEESYARILDFMSKENEAFMNSLPAAQQQMIQGWEDTWKKAKGVLEDNYAEISGVLYDEQGNLYSEEDVLNYFKENNEAYLTAQQSGDIFSMQLLERQWQETYQNVVNALRDNAEFDPHNHTLSDVVSKIDELKDNIFNVNIIGITGTAPTPYGLSDYNGKAIDFSNGEQIQYADIDSHFKPKDPEPAPSTGGGDDGGGGKGNAKVYKAKVYYSASSGAINYVEATSTISQKDAEQKAWKKVPANAQWGALEEKGKEEESKKKATNQTPSSVNLPQTTTTTNEVQTTIDAFKNVYDGIKNLFGFSEGGLVDYTGLAMVHGNKTRPEAFLSATDTENIRSMLDMFNYVKTTPYMSHIDSSMYGNTTNVGDINITINQAEINSDADVDKLAKRVGAAFSKELSRNGLNLSGYAF